MTTMRTRPAASQGWLLVAVGLLVSCVGPARTSTDYIDKGQTSAAASLSAVRSAELAVDDLRRDGLFAPQVSIVLSDAADEASSAEDAFASIQPPGPSLDRYRSELDAVLEKAGDVLATLRIDARRTDAAGVIARATELPSIAQELRRFTGSQA